LSGILSGVSANAGVERTTIAGIFETLPPSVDRAVLYANYTACVQTRIEQALEEQGHPILPQPKIMIVDSLGRTSVKNALFSRFAGDGTYLVDAKAPLDQWISQARDIGDEKPTAIVAHLHALQPLGPNPAKQVVMDAENQMMIGLRAIWEKSPSTAFILYSRSFEGVDAAEFQKRLGAIAYRLTEEGTAERTRYEIFIKQIGFAYLPNNFGQADVELTRNRIIKGIDAAKTRVSENTKP
jgi:hypothetical protein